MAQFSKLFRRDMLCDSSTEVQLNRFLAEYPNYKVIEVSFKSYPGTCMETLFVVFEISEDRSETSFQEDLEFFVNDCTNAQLKVLYERVSERLKEKGEVTNK